MASEPLRRAWRPLAALRRHAVAITALLLVTALYLLLPALARPLLERSLTAALGQPVAIGALHWHPLRGEVSADQVVVGDDDRRVHVGRLLMVVDLSALLRRRLALERVVLDRLAAEVTLDDRYRPTLLQLDGGNRPDGAALPELEVEVAELAVHASELRVRYPVGGAARAIRLAVPKLAAREIRVAGGGTEVSLKADLDASIDGAALNGNLDLRLAGDDRRIRGVLSISGLQVDRKVIDLPATLGSFSGKLHATAAYELSPAAPGGVVGLDLRLDDVILYDREDLALSARRISAEAVRFDVRRNHIEVPAVAIDAPAVALQITSEGVALPRQAAPAQARGSARGPVSFELPAVRIAAVNATGADVRVRYPLAGSSAETRLALTQVAVSGVDVSADGQRVHMASGRIDVSDGMVTTAHHEQSVVVAVRTATWGGFREGRAAPLRLEVESEGGGSLTASGQLSAQPLHLDLDLDALQLSLPGLTRGMPLPLHLVEGTVGGKLNVKYGDSGLWMRGTLRADAVKTIPPSAERPTEVMAVHAAEAEISISPEASSWLDIGSLKLSYPYVMVQRYRGGVFPYSVFATDGGPRTTGAPAERGMRMRRLEIEAGRLELIDGTLEPPYWGSLTGIALRARDVDLGKGTVADVDLSGHINELSPAKLKGSLTAKGLSGSASIRDLLLDSLNPFLPGLLGYKATAGRLTLSTTAVPSLASLDTNTHVVLTGIEVEQTGLDVLQSQSGVPFRVALSLIKTPAGEIDLRLPVAVDTTSGQVSLGSVIGQAIRSAVIGAITSPLRLLGNWFGLNNAPHAFAIDPISFPAGKATLDDQARQRIAQIGRIAQMHPGLLIVALPQLTDADLEEVGTDGAIPLARQRNEALRQQLVESDDGPRMTADRLMLEDWKPADGAKAIRQPGIYIELQAR